jgi:parallel beta-helix repeat protein
MAIREQHRIGQMGLFPCNSNGNVFTTVQAAINDLAGDGWVYVPAGDWAENITISDNLVTLFGVGRDSYINGGTTGDGITVTGTDCHIYNLRVSTTIDGGASYHGIDVAANYCWIHNVYISQSDRIGIYLNATNAIITDCYIQVTQHWGIYLDAGADNCIVSNNSINNTSYDGIETASTAEYNVITGNLVLAWTGEPINCNSSTTVVANNNCGGSVMNSLGCSHGTIQGAIDHVEAYGEGGVVTIPIGTWDEELTIQDDAITLQGMGKGSILVPADGTAISCNGDYDYVTIRDLAIDSKAATGGTAISIGDGADYFLIDNVTIVDSDSQGITIHGAPSLTGGIVQNCVILGADNNGIQIEMDGGSYSYHIKIINNHITSCGSNGIYLSSSGTGNYYTTISGNTIVSCGANGMYLREMYNGTVDSNVCMWNTQDGIEISTAEFCSINGNSFSKNVQHGISGVNTDFCVYDSNNLQGNDSGNSETYDGINLDASSVGVIISNNICYGNSVQRRGISNDGMQAVITGNYCRDNDYNGIYCNATDCTISNNRLYDNSQAGAGGYDEMYLDSGADRANISNNTIGSPGNSSESCIYAASGTHDLLIQGNWLNDGMGSGIELAGNQNCNISGNSIYNCDDHGIVLTNVCHSCIITGNKLYGNGGYGIELTASCDFNQIQSNFTSNNTTGSFNIAAASCDSNLVCFNTTEEGAFVDAGTTTRAFGNYDPSANAFVGDVGAAPF